MKRHKDKPFNYGTCAICGATREWRHYKRKSPWLLNDQRQPLCPGRQDNPC